MHLVYLSLSGLVPHKRMLQQLVCVGSLMVVFHQNCLNKVLKFTVPPFRLQAWWWVSKKPKIGLKEKIFQRLPWNKEKCPHGVHITQRWLCLCHLYSSDSQGPEVRPVVIGGIWVLITRNHLWGHPVGCPNKGVPEMLHKN